MNGKHLFPLLLMFTFAANAQQAPVDSFSVNTLGEAASRVGDLAKPMTVEVEVALTGPVWDIGPLVTYLRTNGFTVEGHLAGGSSAGAANKSLALVGKKTAVFSREEIERHERAMRPLVPKAVGLNWRFGQSKADH